MEPSVIGVIGLLFGSLIAWLALRSRGAALSARLSLMEKELAAGKADLERFQRAHTELVAGKAKAESALEAERKTSNEKIELVTRASEELRKAFKAMAADALKSNNSSFLVIAEETLKRFQSQAKGDLEARQKAVADMVAPVRDSLNKVDAQIQQMEVARGDAYGELRAQVQSLITTQKELQSETGNLVRALRTPNVRGRWGEIQLRRVVEIAGMLSYCDFSEQETVTTDTGRLRPDLVVNLPGGKHVVVDAKTPLQAFLDAFETNNEETRRACLANHARQVRDHMNTLSGKKYWEQFEATPEFVVMFLPGETLQQIPAWPQTAPSISFHSACSCGRAPGAHDLPGTRAGFLRRWSRRRQERLAAAFLHRPPHVCRRASSPRDRDAAFPCQWSQFPAR